MRLISKPPGFKVEDSVSPVTHIALPIPTVVGDWVPPGVVVLSPDPPDFTFHPHFHPFAGELVRRLVTARGTGVEGVAELQSADTAYAKDRILVTNAEGGVASVDNSERRVPVGLVDGRVVLLAYGADVTVPGVGRVRLTSDVLEALPTGTEVSLVGGYRATVVVFDGQVRPFNVLEFVELGPGSAVTLAKWKPQPEPQLYSTVFSWKHYRPGDMVRPPYPSRELDFSATGPASGYAVYNMELFYWIPLALGIHLSKNQRFDDAKKWFQYVFNPEDDGDGPAPERFWQVRPLQTTDIRSVEEILINLSSGDDPALRANTIECIQKWMDNPYRPHLIARFRPTAYMYKAVMVYLDNLIAWGDSLFRQDRPESVDDAADRYIEAREILGPRPQVVPKRGSVRPATYARLKAYAATRGRTIDEFSNVLVDLESDLAFADVSPGGTGASAGVDGLLGVGREALYFCIPPNDKLIAYWATVADRLFKIQNSLNIMGVFRELPLFEPEIDPGLLAKGVAAGLDVSAILAGLNQPLPLVRFQFLIQKALESCQEARSLGDKLLAVMEKEDNEALAILRAQHESTILAMAEMVKYAQWQEAIKAREGLAQSFESATQRFVYYERLLGTSEADIEIPGLDQLEAPNAALERKRFKSKEPEVAARPIDVDIAEDAGGATGGKIKTLSGHELEELEKLGEAQQSQDDAASLEAIAAAVRLIPEILTQIEPLGVGAGFGIGGADIAAVLQIFAGISRATGARRSYEAGRAVKLGGYARREQDWTLQRNLAAREINQAYKQYVAAQIREAVAEKEWKNHKKQMEHSKRIEEFLTNERSGKKTNQAFYVWMKREVNGLYGQSFRFAMDVAQKAERALQHELGDRNQTFLQAGYLGGKEGLLAGDKLYSDLKRMEMAYYTAAPDLPGEVHVSLLQVSPLALLQLRATGRCSFSLPEELFDLSLSGLYFRRIRSVAVSIPCVTGPYQGVNCTLTHLKSTIRRSADVSDGYERGEGDDQRFEDYYGVESIVVRRGQNDNGRLQAERTAREEAQRPPFEGKGAISSWRLELPADPSKGDPALFDYGTISDVVMHIQYTGRQGEKPLKDAAKLSLKAAIEDARMAGSTRLFSIRHDFSGEWARFKKSAAEDSKYKLEIALEKRHYPYWAQGRLGFVASVELFANGLRNPVSVFDHSGSIGTLEKKGAAQGNLYSTTLVRVPDSLDTPADRILALYFTDNTMDDLWVAVTWGGS